ncbi:methylenetetrahydrofolate reductase [bacterium]|nr:methylenetetrahydrofolate reductase [bacterium]MBU1073961.1 methylenetetrahydrofolate reductase [bacterium]MBU1674407.1 methylenetetrahydrofolate reductase [bacterium]
MKIGKTLAARRDPFFSFELTPPERGMSISDVTEIVDQLIPFDPLFIDVTNHAADSWFEELDGASYVRHITRKRPGTLGLCAALKYRYDVETVPHLLCHGFTQEETEDALIELSFLDIHNVLAVRGDTTDWKEVRSGARNKYAADVVRQIVDMNHGRYLHKLTDAQPTDFCIGVAAYPEKHFEAPSLAYDIQHLKAKVDAGADYVITQMFFDNAPYFSFVERCRAAGITVPIIPGLKVVGRRSLLTNIPRNFHVDLPDGLVDAVAATKDAGEAGVIGVEHAFAQARGLLDGGAPGVHFFVYNDARLTAEVLQKLDM